MSHSNQALKISSLVFLTILGLMAFMATGAQASANAWLENAADITGNKAVEVSAHTEMLLDVEALQLVIHCSTVQGKGVQLIAGTTTAAVEIWYSTCKVLEEGILNNTCDSHLNGTQHAGLVEPIKTGGRAKLVLVGGKTQLLLEPGVAGGNIAQLKFDPPCPLPEVNNIKGTILFECLKPSNLEAVDCKQEELAHLLKQNEVEADKLTFGVNPAKLLGISKVQLASDNPWCGHV